MRCRECGRTWPDGVLFCRECGSPLEPDDNFPGSADTGGRICSECGALVPDGDNFCVVCGSLVVTSPATPQGRGTAIAAVAAVAAASLGLIVVLAAQFATKPADTGDSSSSVTSTSSSNEETADALVSVSEVLSDSYPKMTMYVSVRDTTGKSVGGLDGTSWSVVEVGEKGDEHAASITGCDPVIEGGSTYKVTYTSTAEKAEGSVLTVRVTVDAPAGLTGSDESSYSRPKEEPKAGGNESTSGGTDKADSTSGTGTSSTSGTSAQSTTSTTSGSQKDPEKGDSTGGGTSAQPGQTPVTPPPPEPEPPTPEPAPPTRVEVISNEFVLPDSFYRYYSASELSGLSDWELRVARNEIYARFGCGFRSEDLQNHFNSCSWYTRRYSPDEFDSLPSPLNDCEVSNVQTIRAVEIARAEATPPPEPPTVSGEYVLPDSSNRFYSVEELSGFSDWDLRLARNEIFARHGRGFNDPDLQNYFYSRSWYTRVYSPEEFDSMPSPLNEYETANVQTIRAIETSR